MIAIKATNFHSIKIPYNLMVLLMFFSVMFGPSPSYPMMAINIILSLLIIIPNMWFYPLKHKNDATSIFNTFKLKVEKFFKCLIITIFSDNGGEYVGLDPTLASHGITHLTSPSHTPKHNGHSECHHRHIVETGLSLLTQFFMPRKYWPLVFATTC